MIREPHGIPFTNLTRVLTYLMSKYQIGYESMEKKENTLLENINKFTSQREFIDAVLAQDIDLCESILKAKPKAIRSVDRKDRFQSAPHIAAEK